MEKKIMDSEKRCPNCGWRLSVNHGSENDPWKHSPYYLGSYYYCSHCNGIFTIKK